MAATPGTLPAADDASQSGEAADNDRITAYLNDPAELSEALRILRDEQAELNILFEGDTQTYRAKILDVAADSFLVVDVQPREGLRNIRAGRQFALSARAPGVYLHSTSNRIAEVESERGLPYFRVPLPERVLYQQRRRSARYSLAPRLKVKGATVLVFREEIEAPLTGNILDVSVGGLRARFERPSLPMLTRDEEVRVAVNMPKLLEFSGGSIVRHADYDSRRQHLTCGIELIEMHVTDRRRLEQLIESIRKSAARRQRASA